MALIVEDGSAKTDSNSYVTVAEADAYASTYGYTDWASTPTVESDDPDNPVDADTAAANLALKEQALILATQSIDLNYGDQYKSPPIMNHQALLFPTLGFYKNRFQYVQSNEIPKELKNAVIEAAMIQFAGGEIFPEMNPQNNVKLSADELGELKSKTEYFKPIQNETLVGFNKIEIILRPIIEPRGKTSSGYMSL